MKSLLFVLLSFSSISTAFASTDPKIELQVYVDLISSPVFSTAVLIERTTGKLKALVDTLTEQKTNQLIVNNNDGTAKVVCQTSNIATSCRFKFVQHFSDILVTSGGYSVNKKLQDFSGLEVMQSNPNLEIPFEVLGEKGQQFNFYLGNGKFLSSALTGL